MPAIHQLYATHCTYGSSAIERRQTGDAKDRVLGYSARASSFTQSELRRHFRTVERFLYYYLPKDSPPERKTSLTPQTAPHRLFFCPSVSGLQALGCISYRREDRAGRVGSYFAHVLTAEIGRNETPWDILECLQLWGAPGWVQEDREAFPYDLPSVQTLSALRPSAPPAVDEQVLWSFLNTPPGGQFPPSALTLLPDRWRQMPLSDRRRYFRLALMGYLEIADQARESLLLLVEPPISVLFFYGIARLLPPEQRKALSFSTFETNADRLMTALAAYTFDNEQTGGDVPPERYRRGFAINTWQSDKVSALREPEAQYADFMLGSLQDVPNGGVAALRAAIDERLARFQGVELARVRDLEDVVKANTVAEKIVQLVPNVGGDAWQKSPQQTAFVRKAVRQKLSGPADPAYLRRVLNSPQHLPLFLDIAVQGDGDDECEPSVRYLVENVQPLERLGDLLGAGEAARKYKLHALEHYVSQKRELPKACAWLWGEKPAAARGPQKPPLLFDLLQAPCVTANVIRASVDVVPADGLNLLFRGVLRSTLDEDDKRFILKRLAARSEFDVFGLLVDVRPEVTAYGPLLKEVVLEPLRQAIDRIHEAPGRFAEVAIALEAGQPLLEGAALARAKAWLDLKRTVDKARLENPPQDSALKLVVPARKKWGFAEALCRCLDRCFPIEHFDGYRKDQHHAIASFVRHVATAQQISQLLPDEWDKYLLAYFRKDVRRMRELKARGPLEVLLDHPLRIAAALAALVVVVIVVILVGSRSRSGTRRTEQVASETKAGHADPAAPATEDGKPQPDTKPPQPQRSTDGGKTAPDSAAHPPADAATPPKPPDEKPSTPPEPAKEEEPGKGPPGDDKGPEVGKSDAAPASADVPSAKDPQPPLPVPPPPSPDRDVLATPLPPSPSSDNPNDSWIELCRGLAPDDYTIRLHGHQVLHAVLPPEASPLAPNQLGKLKNVAPRIENKRLEVRVQFEKQRSFFDLASFFVSEGALRWRAGRVAKELEKDEYLRNVRYAIRYCVVELQPSTKSPSSFLALARPSSYRFPFNDKGRVLVQAAKENSLNLPPAAEMAELYLGAGKVLHPAQPAIEFGGTWRDEAPRTEWPILALQALFGFDTFHVALAPSGGGNVELVLKPGPRKNELAVAKQKLLEPLKDRKNRIEIMLKTATMKDPPTLENRLSGRVSDMKLNASLKATANLAKEVGVTEVKAFPQPPPAMIPRDQMREHVRAYNEGLQEFQTWARDVLGAAVTKTLTDVQQEIDKVEQEYADPLAKAEASEEQFAEWLQPGVKIEACLYRRVPCDADGATKYIRVLVNEPGESSPAVDANPAADASAEPLIMTPEAANPPPK
jgi:hypothetical protein